MDPGIERDRHRPRRDGAGAPPFVLHVDLRSPEAQAALFALPALLLALRHAYTLGTWLVDDAGISFAYALNLARGDGWVAQPDAERVEGFSNPSWVLLHFLPAIFGLLDPLYCTKLISFGFVAATLWLGALTMRARLGMSAAASVAAPLLLAGSAPFAVWSMSGLENPLYAFLLLGAFTAALGWVEHGGQRRAAAVGAAVGLAALTRPEGVLFALPVLPAAVYRLARGGITGLRAEATAAAAGVVAFTATLAPYLVFRRLYYGSWTPNTHLAKGGPTLDMLREVLIIAHRGRDEALNILASVVGTRYNALAGVVLIVVAVHLLSARPSVRRLLTAAFVVTGASAFLLLPSDWMEEWRFTTPFYVFLTLGVAAAVDRLAASVTRPGRLRDGLTLLLIAAVVVPWLRYHDERVGRFAQHPTIPLAYVTEAYGDYFNRYAEILGHTERLSLLLPDVGGPLLVSTLKLYDLGMLCDREIARTLRKDTGAFHDYIFERAKPSIIHIHGVWAGFADFGSDPRFARDYTAVIDGLNYVRKDVLARKPGALELLKKLPRQEVR